MEKPKPYCKNPGKVKAFVLGCDPTAFSKEERLKPVELRKHLDFKTVFNLDFKPGFNLGRDKRYFAGVLSNLKEIDLSLENIYVQNLVSDYQKEESSKNRDWIRKAQGYIKGLIEEFDKIDPSRNTPVLLTSELLYKALLNDGIKKVPARDFYELKAEIPIPPDVNKLGRPLIPFYRHRAYALGDKHKAYSQQIIKILDAK
jgi:hypothetical protein